MSEADDPFDLERFLSAQAGYYDNALAELKAGRKTTHWIWYVFPQLEGLGRSSTAKFYGLASRQEAEAYLAHPVLGRRLVEATGAVLAAAAATGRDLHQILGSPDDLKFRSCMTLFEAASGSAGDTAPDGATGSAPRDGMPFAEALAKLCGGTRDQATLGLLRRA